MAHPWYQNLHWQRSARLSKGMWVGGGGGAGYAKAVSTVATTENLRYVGRFPTVAHRRGRTCKRRALSAFWAAAIAQPFSEAHPSSNPSHLASSAMALVSLKGVCLGEQRVQRQRAMLEGWPSKFSVRAPLRNLIFCSKSGATPPAMDLVSRSCGKIGQPYSLC